jgi:uncharacterized protein YjbI with pentapeptide repeats
MRKSYAASFEELSEAVELVGEPRPEVLRPPRHDDRDVGPTIFRYAVSSVDLFDLTLPGLFVGRSELRHVSFTGSDLHNSTLNWNDVQACDFSGCDLSGSDLRGCSFESCSFASADLARADLRHSAFSDCDFRDAKLDGVILSGDQGRALGLAEDQSRRVAWTDEPDEPQG